MGPPRPVPRGEAKQGQVEIHPMWPKLPTEHLAPSLASPTSALVQTPSQEMLLCTDTRLSAPSGGQQPFLAE